MDNTTAKKCGYKNGRLPECAPLAVPFIPMQQSALPRFEPSEALAKGTLFPGLELPFMDMVNAPPETTTPRRELMALDFALDELELYLDTHEDDEDAFEVYQGYLQLAEEAHSRYVQLYGPVTQMDMLGLKHYVWLENPWPWDYEEGGAR